MWFKLRAEGYKGNFLCQELGTAIKNIKASDRKELGTLENWWKPRKLKQSNLGSSEGVGVG